MAVAIVILTRRESVLRVQVAIKFVYIGVGAAVASYLREFFSHFF